MNSPTPTPNPPSDPDACLNATMSFNDNTNCTGAFIMNVTDLSVLCHGICRSYLNIVASTCGDQVSSHIIMRMYIFPNICNFICHAIFYTWF